MRLLLRVLWTLLLFLIASAAAQHGWLHGVRRMTWRWLRGAGICTQHSQRARTAATARHVPTIGNDLNASGGVEGWTLEESRASVLKKSGSKEPVHKAASCCIIMTRDDMTRSEIATHHTRVYRSTALHDFIASTLEHPNLPIATPKVSFIATPIFQH